MNNGDIFAAIIAVVFIVAWLAIAATIVAAGFTYVMSQ